MARFTGTIGTDTLIGQREDLEDVIYRITPEEVPLTSSIGRTKVSAVAHEWQIDTLATPAANTQLEGDEYSFTAPGVTTRVKNYTQTAWKTVLVTDTSDVVDKAGRDKELAYQLTKRGLELKKDIEYSLLSPVASVAGNSTTARVSAGLPSWLTTNDVRNTGGVDGGYSSGTGLVSAPTSGTLRAFTKALLDSAIQLTYTAGGNPSIIMLSPYNKGVFSTFMSDTNVAPFRVDATTKGKNTIVASADMYLSNFGLLTVIPNRVMATDATRARNVFVLTPDMAKLGILRPMQTEEVAKTGDANKRVIKTEFCFVCANEAAHGVVADVFGLTSAT